MATTELEVTSVIASSGWLPDPVTPSEINTSNDVRATQGEAGEFINCEIDDVPGDFGSMNDVTLHVEAREQGTISRVQFVTMTLRDSGDLVLETFGPTDITNSDVVYNSSAFSRSDNSTVINGWRLRAEITEGGGMAEDETVEIDDMWVTLDYNVSGGGRTMGSLAGVGGLAGAGGIAGQGGGLAG